MRTLALIGMPGAGKSTIGVLLAKALRMQFLDIDLAIQEQKRATFWRPEEVWSTVKRP